ncbi:MAG TPA: hypothetical protein VLJ17_24650 [Xanthobacteraceae bacterium]|nr:hypothetical protein [Xanthobacteraceae bacterium]
MWYRLWQFKTANFTAQLDWKFEQDPDLSWADEDVLRAIEAGIYNNVTFRVRVLFRGREISADYLGNSVYENVMDFRRERRGYFRDMVRTTTAEARKAFANMPRIKAA